MPTDSKTGGAKGRKRQPTRGPRGRRVLRVEKVPLRVRLARALESRSFGWGVLHTLAFLVVAMVIGVAAPALRDPAVGRLATETLTARTTVELADRDATENLRERARQLSPQVYIIEGAAIDEVISSIASLPAALGGVTEAGEVAPEILERFELDATSLAALAVEAETPAAWEASITRLRDELTRRPLLEGPVFQRAVQHPAGRVELRSRTTAERVPVGDLLNLADSTRVLQAGEDMARRVGVAPALRRVVASRLASAGRSTFRLDDAASAEAAQSAADAVEEQFQTYPEGAVIYRRGEVVTAAQRDLAVAEDRAYAEASPLWRRWAERLSIAGGVLAVTFGIVGYIVAYCPRIRRNPGRMAGLSMLLLGSLGVAAFGVVADPGLAPVFLVAPVVFAGGILTIAYDPRTALAVSTLLTILVTFVLGGDVGTLAITEAGLAAAAWRLSEIRDRRALLGMAGWTSAAMSTTAVGVGLALLPLSGAALLQIGRDAGLLALAGIGCGAVLLFVLPLVERFFRITTGMTLIELRDPKQPLLREIQQRAPGTYNHSLNVASIAETAADAIGADALLTYVGGLYHDVGKINKPGYFVENQGGAASKHDKLDPAMSLLVIVGHVKDGLEIAREYGLPRELHHFIEGHHGTTLVEYFYHLAVQKAASEAGEGQSAELTEERADKLQVEHRYPGPRPQTREVAILMLADGVESATRTLPDPTPARIDQLVRQIADKRLRDGQFDECDLTLRELSRICESISQSVASIHHGRIAYPGDAAKRQPKTEPAPAAREDEDGDGERRRA